MNNVILPPPNLALVSVCLVIVGSVVVWATRDTSSINELDCERKGVTGRTTMYELRKPGPYVIVEQPDGDTIAIPKDGIRCQRVE